MRVRVFPNETARHEGAWSDGISIPAQSRFASFSEETRTAYVARLEGPQATRSALLYAACLQFHSLSRPKNLDIGRTWHAWGIALDFSRSTWDGEKLAAFAQPRVESVDLPGKALLAMGNGDPDLSKLVASDAVDPALTWGLAAMCLHGSQAAYRTAFHRYALGETGTKLGTEDFLRTLGPAKKLSKDLRAFLLSAQVPFETVGDWEDRGSAGIVGHDAGTKVGFCVLRAGVERLTARVSELPKVGGRMGFVAGWAGPEDCAQIDIEAPEVLIRVTRLGKAVSQSRLPIPGDAHRERTIALERVGSQYTLTVDGTRFTELELPSGRMGFFVVGTDVAFRDVTWR
ncbi:MAG: hypothetical protein NTY35_08000 [Planctomycetota bacterium]|nr:hypothetical protein [Planctomycetota bacterium]